jgi:hypothetical protein
MMNYVTVQTGWGPRRRVVQRRINARRVLLTISSNQQHRITKVTKTPEKESVDLEGKDVKDGQEGKA